MKTEKFSIYLGKIQSYFKKVYVHLKEYKRLLHIRYRAWRLNNNTDKTMGDKLRTLAAKADAIDEYHKKWCNPKRLNKLKVRENQKVYNAYKEWLKDELQALKDDF